ncbi:MAG: hypothetical protein LBG17_03990 [Bacteroidales bacterium]|jgi:hypothetical protein|nr:hypothetical protein [Bacteroidales bacterium]
MKKKKHLKPFKTAVTGLLMLFAISAFAQNDLPVICVSGTSYNLMADSVIEDILNNVKLQVEGTRGEAKDSTFQPTITFTANSSPAFTVNSNGNVTNITAGGMIGYTVTFDTDITFVESVEGSSGSYLWTDPCTDSTKIIDWNVPGGEFELLTVNVSGSFKGTVVLALTMPDITPTITGTTCFDDEIALSVQSVFSNFDCQWSAEGLTTSDSNQSSVVYTVPNNSANSEYEINFTVTDNVCGDGTSISAEPITVKQKTQKPAITQIDSCIPIGQSTVNCTIDDFKDDYDYNWYFRTNNVNTLVGTEESVTVNIGNSSGSVFVQAVGLCGDTAISDLLQINRELSDSSILWASKTDCIFQGDTVRFSTNPTLQEEMEWTYPTNWGVVGANNTGTLLAHVNSSDTVRVKSKACPNTELSIPVEVSQVNITVKIEGDTCLASGSTFTFTADVNGAEDLIYTWNGLGATGSNDTFTGTVPTGISRTQQVKVTVEKCGKTFSDSIYFVLAPAKPETVTPSKTCINKGMEDTLTFEIASVLGATGYTWDVTGGTKINDSILKIKVATNGQDVTVSVAAEKDGCNTLSEESTVTVSASGMGIDYSLLIDDLGNNDDFTVYFDVLDWNNLTMPSNVTSILWMVNDNTTSYEIVQSNVNKDNGYIDLQRSMNSRPIQVVHAIVSAHNTVCKTKFSTNTP